MQPPWVISVAITCSAISLRRKIAYQLKKLNSVARVRERIIQTEWPPLLSDVSANFLPIEVVTWSAWRILTAIDTMHRLFISFSWQRGTQQWKLKQRSLLGPPQSYQPENAVWVSTVVYSCGTDLIENAVSIHCCVFMHWYENKINKAFHKNGLVGGSHRMHYNTMHRHNLYVQHCY
jgi:hypothetical protein